VRKLIVPVVTTLFAVCTMGLLTGCAHVAGSPVNGFWFMDVSAPSWHLHAPLDAGVQATKTGEATATTILGLIATGDASVDAAMKNGGITKVHHIDIKAHNILGIIGKFTLVVYGE
jgi:hypothetical protein